MTAKTPWNICKVSFDIANEEAAWEYDVKWPHGWELKETYATPIMCQVIFEVEGIPSIIDGNRVKKLIAEIDKQYEIEQAAERYAEEISREEEY